MAGQTLVCCGCLDLSSTLPTPRCRSPPAFRHPDLATDSSTQPAVVLRVTHFDVLVSSPSPRFGNLSTGADPDG